MKEVRTNLSKNHNTDDVKTKGFLNVGRTIVRYLNLMTRPRDV